MNLALLVASLLIVADSSDSKAPATADLEAYQAARTKAGRDPDANVRLALWCESRGLDAERLKHLSLAALADPTHATARALMGLVSENGRWGRPETVAARIKADPAMSTLRVEYETRRSKTESTADAHWELARWCEKVGLSAESSAHDTAVTRLDPTREAAWKKLGCKKFEGLWMTPDQAEAIKANREDQAQADRRWQPLLERWKDGLARPNRRAEAENALLALNDPRAVRSIWKVFARGGPKDQSRAIRLFSQVDSTDASRGMAILAVFGGTEDVRRAAIETLRGRDVRGTLDLVIRLIREPINFVAKPNQGVNSPGLILVEGKNANLERIYPATMPNLNSPAVLRRLPEAFEAATERANVRFLEDLNSLQLTNLTIEGTNRNAVAALRGVTGKDIGADRFAWVSWWTDRQGYALKAAPDQQTAEKPTFTQVVDPYAPSHSCFASGTPVMTLEGLRSIETLKVGDRILTQDTATGVLGYQPALAVFHNPPANTLRVKIGGETIVATGIHRFWKAGQGWVMARDLKVGDAIRRLGDLARVEAVDPDKNQPVFNLEVARGGDFFVGKAGVLVHDNSLVERVAKPFDAAPEVAGIASNR